MPPKVPSLYTALTVGKEHAANPIVYGTNSIAHVLEHNQVIEIIVNNADDGTHPFHLHGHNFQLIHRSEEDAGPFERAKSGDLGNRRADSKGRMSEAGTVVDAAFPKVPMRRDTVYVRGNGNIVLRFRSDNPGVWLFHCHIEWHMDQGLVATIVEAPAALQDLEIPEGHLDVCKTAGILTHGNAAGNTKDALDLRGENRPPPPLPDGFTGKGYIAMIASCASAFIGLTTIAW